MADLVSIKSKILNSEIETGSIEAEVLNQRLGANLNGLIDATDTNETRLQAREGKNEAADTPSAQTTISTSTTATVATNTITPETTNVLILPAGGVWFDGITASDPLDGGDANPTLRLRRGTTVLLELTDIEHIRGILVFSGMGFYDTGATAGVSNSYNLQVVNNSGTIDMVYEDAALTLVEF